MNERNKERYEQGKLVVAGSALVYGADISADDILPHRFRVEASGDEAMLGKFAMAGVDPDYYHKIGQFGILVAGRNFGMGSTRAHATIALVSAGTRAVVAESFGVIFFRTALNYGLPVLECPDVLKVVREGDEIEVDLPRSEVRTRSGIVLHGRQMHPYLLERLALGGLIPHLRKQMGLEGGSHERSRG